MIIHAHAKRKLPITSYVIWEIYIGTSQQFGKKVERQGKANKSTTPRTVLSFQRKEELPWVGFEPMTICSLGERSATTYLLPIHNTQVLHSGS